MHSFQLVLTLEPEPEPIFNKIPAGRFTHEFYLHRGKMYLNTPAEFSFSECLIFLNRSDNECLHCIENGKIRKLIKVNGELVLFELSDGGENRIGINFLNSEPGKVVKEKVVEYVTNWFDLNYDLKLFYKMAKTDSLLKNLVSEYYGLRLIGVPDFFEAVCWAIIGQHINLTFAYSVKRRFVEEFGESLKYDDREYWLFPHHSVIVNVPVDDLMQLQFTEKKAEYITAFANALNEGSIGYEEIACTRDYENAKDKLLVLKGVGNWTANYVMMKCFRFPDAFPIEDVGLHNAIKQKLNLDKKPSIEEIKKLAQGWKGYEAYATFYLWRSLV